MEQTRLIIEALLIQKEIDERASTSLQQQELLDPPELALYQRIVFPDLPSVGLWNFEERMSHSDGCSIPASSAVPYGSRVRITPALTSRRAMLRERRVISSGLPHEADLT